MSIESELRSVADVMAKCRARTLLDTETNRVLNWAVMELHNIARQVRRVSQGMVGAGVQETEVDIDLIERRITGEERRGSEALESAPPEREATRHASER